jgi:hypothetical protein
VGHLGIAVALGLVAGVAAGARPTGAAGARTRWWPVAVAGMSLQAVTVVADLRGALGLAAVLASFVALAAFAVANLAITGMRLVLLGLTLNLTSMVVNGGMPVRGEALVRAGLVEPADVGRVDLGPKRHLETEDDPAPGLGDVLPVAPLRQVLSVGDVALAAGLAVVTFRLVHPSSTRSARTLDLASRSTPVPPDLSP